jgi:spore coat polysaccharide biosynthesis protein SpsF (cytidylyltransferase family)
VDLSDFRWTVDYPEDLQFVRAVFAQFVGVETTFGMNDVLNLLSSAVIQNNSKSKVFRNISLGMEKPVESL